MDINYTSALESHDEEILVGTIRKLKPTDIIKSKVLVAVIREFFERGTAEDCWELVPPTHKAVLLSTPPPDALQTSNISASKPSVSNPEEGVSSSTASVPSHASQKAPLSAAPEPCVALREASLSTAPAICAAPLGASVSTVSKSCAASADTSEPLAFLLSLKPTHGSVLPSGVPVPDHIEADVRRLVKAIDGFKAATPHPLESYKTLWSAREAIFDVSEGEPIGKFGRLQLGRDKIKKASSQYDCADRLTDMYFAHHVDYIVETTIVKDKLPPGQGRLTAAFKQLSEDSGIPVDVMKEDYGGCRNFFQVLHEEGPGSLLENGPNMTSMWKKKLTKQNIKDVFKYRASRLPLLKERADLLNRVGAVILLDGLRVIGWSDSEIFSSDTRLIQGIKKHLPDDVMEIYHGMSRPSKKRCRNAIDVDGAKAKARTPRPRKSHASNQTRFAAGGATAGTCLPPGDVGSKDRRPSCCSSIPTSSDPRGEFIFNDVGQTTMTEPSAAGDTASTAMSQLPNPGQEMVASIDLDLTRFLAMSGDLPDHSGWDPNQWVTDEDLTRSLDTSGDLPDHSGWDPNQWAVDEDLMRSLDTSGDLPDLSALNSNQRSINPNMLTKDPYMIDPLSCHQPSSVESGSSQDATYPNMNGLRANNGIGITV